MTSASFTTNLPDGESDDMTDLRREHYPGRDSSVNVDALVQEVLDDELSQIDSDVISRLDSIRDEAVQSASTRSSRWHLPWWFGQWAPATAVAAVAMFIAVNIPGFWSESSKEGGPESIADYAEEMLLLELGIGEQGLDFYQQLAFVEWMEDEGLLVWGEKHSNDA